MVVDTGVPITASGSSQAGLECTRRCRAAVAAITADQARLILDGGWLIIGEYRNNLSSTGQPGLGDSFLKWVLTNRDNPARCVRVPIRSDGSGYGFEEFPKAADLADFDKSDMKFVAVALAHGADTPLQVAVDSKWWGWKAALARERVKVELLCPDEVKAIYCQKFPDRVQLD